MLLLLLACTGDPPVADDTGGPFVDPSPVDQGPWEAGVTTIEFTDRRGKDLTVEVWYPAHVSADAQPDPYDEMSISLNAYRDVDAAVDEGPFRLIAFTHGHIAIRYQSAFLMEHLASHGFVVVAPDHYHDTFLDAHESELWQIVLERPGDITESVDEVLKRSAEGDRRLGGLVLGAADPDTVEYAIMGHSLGSITSLSVGGGEVDFEAFNTFCEDPEAQSLQGCRRVDEADPADVANYTFTDDRAVVTVPMSPGLWYAFGPDGVGLETVRQPLVMAGDLDDLLDYTLEERPVWEAMASPKALVTVEDAGHYAFSDLCLILPVWDECQGEAAGYIEMDEAKTITRGVVTSWVEAKLRGETEQLDWLAGWLPDHEKAHWEEE